MHRSKFDNTTPYQSDVLEETSETILHEKILDILFKHKKDIHGKLIDLQGAFLIDHFSIKIIDPDRKLLIFSISPSVEYNLIVHGLWKHDFSFSIPFQNSCQFYEWKTAYAAGYENQLRTVKELNHGFTFGFNISRKIEDFTLIYSFATRSRNKNIDHFYGDHLNELSSLGNYGFKLIRPIYEKYCSPRTQAPIINCRQKLIRKPQLRLIVNNQGSN